MNIARRFTFGSLAALCVLLAGLAFTAAPAFAAGSPEIGPGGEFTSPQPKPTEEVRFEAAINPNEEPTKCDFQYGETAAYGHEAPCTEPGETAEGTEQRGAVTVKGLKPGTTYHYRVVLKNTSGKVEGADAEVTTLPVPSTEVPSPVGATTATFKGTLTPLSSIVPAEYFFSYNVGEEIACTGEHATSTASAGIGSGVAKVSTAVTELEPDQKYTVCLLSTNTLGDSEEDLTPKYFETLPAPPTVVSESAPALVTPAPVTGSLEAALHAEVNANNQATTVYFQYSTSPVLVGKSLATPTDVPAAPGASIGSGFGNVGAEAATGPVLTSGTLYYYQAVAINPTGTTYGTVEHFETLGVPVVQTSAAEEVTAASAELGGKLDAGGEAEYYVEYGTEPCSAITMTCGTKSTPVHVSGKVQQCTLGGVLQECVTPIAVTGLEPGRTYHYWLVATNAAASEPVHGAAEEFTTKAAAPTVQTGAAKDVTETSAQLTGELNPGAGEAEYYVEYVLPTDVIERSATGFASGRTLAGVGPIVLSGLQPNTTYYYWLVAKSAAVSEPVRGETLQFTTPRSQAELEAQAAANRKPAEELAAANAAKQKLEEEAQHATETAAAANAAKQRQYAEIAAETAALDRLEAEAGKRSTEADKAKPRRASCRKGSIKKKNKCVPEKSKKKGKVKQ